MQQLNIGKQTVTATGQKSDWRIWWRLLRPHTLTASFIPVMVGSALALEQGEFHPGLFMAMLVASMLIQSATNMFNEYYDWKRGLDTEHSVGIGGAIVRDGVSAHTVLRIAYSFFAIAMLLGVYICMASTWWIAVIGIVSMSVGYFYTGGPKPIAYTPFGELASGICMGPVIVSIAYYIQTGAVTIDTILVSVPIAILIGAILMANNIRDLDGDKENGRKTLAILLGRKRAIMFLAYMFTVSYVWTAALVILGNLPIWTLVVLISIPKAKQAISRFRGRCLAIQLMPAMAATAQLNTQFGLLMIVGLIIGLFI